MRVLRAHERIFEPQAFAVSEHQDRTIRRDYLSSWSLFGVPLVHFQLGIPELNDRPAFAWIAGGSEARGLLFAWGGVAIAPISVGIISCGVLSVGAVGIGLISTGSPQN